MRIFVTQNRMSSALFGYIFYEVMDFVCAISRKYLEEAEVL